QLHSIHRDVLSAMQSLRQTYSNLACCIGDTPCCSTADDFSGIDQISPGNFVFYDCMQRQIGSCRTEDIAVALAVPVVARYPGRRELIVHGGAIHLSREALDWQSQQGNETMYGLVTRLGDKCWSEPVEGAFVSALSQEHGVITGPSSLVESVKPGDLLGVLPVHSCLTANLAPNYHLLQKNTVIDCMP
ncbi:MAG: hypothetical protein R3281_09865, partial [Balneolaceae bacterium]|nr:hypothetical protein [Balneolaceae bacterium]